MIKWYPTDQQRSCIGGGEAGNIANMNPKSRVAVIDGNTDFVERVHQELLRRDFFVEPFDSLSSARAYFEGGPELDVVCFGVDSVQEGDLESEGDVFEFQDEIRRQCPESRLIVLVPNDQLRIGFESVARGAFLYLRKPCFPEEIVAAVTCASGNDHKVESVEDSVSVSGLVGRHPIMRRLVESIQNIASLGARSTVLVQGESGTGKEVVARAIHDLAGGDEPFVGVNCGAFSPSLLEDQLFGHVRGAFTGAVNDKYGVFVAAGRGTLFLDEITEIPPETQAKLLRAIQEREVTPLGADTAVPWHARLIVASNRDVDEEVSAGRFRKDLFYRINVIRLALPALRDRREDVPILAHFFLDEFAREGAGRRQLSRHALEALMAYDFPGNVRELRNALERALALGGSRVLGPQDLPVEFRESSRDKPIFKPLLDLEREHVVCALRLADGKKLRAARSLQIDRNRRRQKFRLVLQSSEFSRAGTTSLARILLMSSLVNSIV